MHCLVLAEIIAEIPAQVCISSFNDDNVENADNTEWHFNSLMINFWIMITNIQFREHSSWAFILQEQLISSQINPLHNFQQYFQYQG